MIVDDILLQDNNADQAPPPLKLTEIVSSITPSCTDLVQSNTSIQDFNPTLSSTLQTEKPVTAKSKTKFPKNQKKPIQRAFVTPDPDVDLKLYKPVGTGHEKNILRNGNVLQGFPGPSKTTLKLVNTGAFDATAEMLSKSYSNYESCKKSFDVHKKKCENDFLNFISEYSNKGPVQSVYNSRFFILQGSFGTDKCGYINCGVDVKQIFTTFLTPYNIHSSKNLECERRKSENIIYLELLEPKVAQDGTLDLNLF